MPGASLKASEKEKNLNGLQTLTNEEWQKMGPQVLINSAHQRSTNCSLFKQIIKGLITN
jgi:hypothetical protein